MAQIGDYANAVLFLIKEPKSRQCQCFYTQAFFLQAFKARARSRPTHLIASPEAVPLSEKENDHEVTLTAHPNICTSQKDLLNLM